MSFYKIRLSLASLTFFLVGSAKGQSDLAAFVLPDGTSHIAFIDANQHVGQVFWQNNQWNFNDLTAATGSVAASPGSGLSTFVLPDGSSHIAFVDVSQHVDQLFFQQNQWNFNDLTAATASVAASPGSGLATFVLSDGTPHIAFVDANQQVDQLFFQQNQWDFNDLTAAAGSIDAAPGTGLSTFILSDGRSHRYWSMSV